MGNHLHCGKLLVNVKQSVIEDHLKGLHSMFCHTNVIMPARIKASLSLAKILASRVRIPSPTLSSFN